MAANTLRSHLPIVSVTSATQNVTKIVLATAGTGFTSHLPGQYVTIHLPLAAGGVERSYSIASAVQPTGTLDLFIRPGAPGSASHWLCHELAAGDELQVSGPFGEFGPRQWGEPLALCGAGTGMAPVIAIAHAAAAQQVAEVRIFSAARDESEHLAADDVTALVASQPGWEYRQWSDTTDGPPNAQAVASWLAASTAPQVFACGPTGFVDLVDKASAAAGVAADRFHRERFDVPPS